MGVLLSLKSMCFEKVGACPLIEVTAMGKVGVLLMSFLKTWVSAMSFKVFSIVKEAA